MQDARQIDHGGKRIALAFVCCAEIAVLLVLGWIQLDMSAQWGPDCFAFFSTMPPEFMALSVFTLAALFFIAYALIGSLTIVGTLFSVLTTLVAVANYYVIEFHGGPLSFLELNNAATAANMMGSYTLDFTPVVLGILLLGAVELGISLIALRAMQKRLVFGRRSWKRSLGLLVDYFAKSDRPTIICMIGDHAPSFAMSVADSETHDEEALEILLRATPFVMWANYGLEADVPEYVSANFIAAIVAQQAGVGLSPYFAYEIELMQSSPVVTAYGAYYDASAQHYSSLENCDPRVRDYLFLDYANIMREGDPALFSYNGS